MPFLLSENDVAELLTMPEAIDALDEAFRFQGEGDDGGAENTPRARFFLPGGVFHHMAAAFPARGVVGTKTYTSFASGTKFYVSLFSSETGNCSPLSRPTSWGKFAPERRPGLPQNIWPARTRKRSVF